MTHQYSRAERLLTRPFPTSTSKRVSTPPEPVNGHVADVFSSKGKSRERDSPQPTPISMPRFPMGSGGMIEVPQEMQERVSRLVDMSVACRYLAAQCQVFHSRLYPWRSLPHDSSRSDKATGPKRLRCWVNRTLSETLVGPHGLYPGVEPT